MTNYEKIKQTVEDKPSLLKAILKFCDSGSSLDEFYCKADCLAVKELDGDCTYEGALKCIERWLDEEVSEETEDVK